MHICICIDSHTHTHSSVYIYIYICMLLKTATLKQIQVAQTDKFGTHPEVLLEEKNKKRAVAALGSIATFKGLGVRVSGFRG